MAKKLKKADLESMSARPVALRSIGTSSLFYSIPSLYLMVDSYPSVAAPIELLYLEVTLSHGQRTFFLGGSALGRLSGITSLHSSSTDFTPSGIESVLACPSSIGRAT